MSNPDDSPNQQAASPKMPAGQSANHDHAAANEPLPPAPSEALFVAKVISTPEPASAAETEPSPSEAENSPQSLPDGATSPAVSIKTAALAIGPVRVGSPFAPGTASAPSIKSSPTVSAVSLAELNALMYLAMGATAAAVLVLLFAILGTILFPVGGLMVATLGVVLAVLGIFSKQKRYQWTAASMIPLHITAAGVCYFRALM